MYKSYFSTHKASVASKQTSCCFNAVRTLLCTTIVLFLCASCGNGGGSADEGSTAVDYAAVEIPQFNADSALAFVYAQTTMGPRTPGSASHQRCAQYLQAQMRRWCDTVIAQPFNTTLWDGKSANGVNIIASLNPQATKRILIGAHWDSRSWADHDPDPANHHTPIDGANDGASGVATIMEMARVMSQQQPSIGIDFIFFDLEDQGTPEWGESDDNHSWCKGSQFWAKNPHTPVYSAQYGVFFDHST